MQIGDLEEYLLDLLDLRENDYKIPSVLTPDDRVAISTIWSEARECGALCFYHWFDEQPQIATKEEAWNAFPDLQHLVESATCCSISEIGEDSFEWCVFQFEDWWVLEAYFAH